MEHEKLIIAYKDGILRELNYLYNKDNINQEEINDPEININNIGLTKYYKQKINEWKEEGLKISFSDNIDLEIIKILRPIIDSIEEETEIELLKLQETSNDDIDNSITDIKELDTKFNILDKLKTIISYSSDYEPYSIKDSDKEFYSELNNMIGNITLSEYSSPAEKIIDVIEDRKNIPHKRLDSITSISCHINYYKKKVGELEIINNAKYVNYSVDEFQIDQIIQYYNKKIEFPDNLIMKKNDLPTSPGKRIEWFSKASKFADINELDKAIICIEISARFQSTNITDYQDYESLYNHFMKNDHIELALLCSEICFDKYGSSHNGRIRHQIASKFYQNKSMQAVPNYNIYDKPYIYWLELANDFFEINNCDGAYTCVLNYYNLCANDKYILNLIDYLIEDIAIYSSNVKRHIICGYTAVTLTRILLENNEKFDNDRLIELILYFENKVNTIMSVLLVHLLDIEGIKKLLEKVIEFEVNTMIALCYYKLNYNISEWIKWFISFYNDGKYVKAARVFKIIDGLFSIDEEHTKEHHYFNFLNEIDLEHNIKAIIEMIYEGYSISNEYFKLCFSICKEKYDNKILSINNFDKLLEEGLYKEAILLKMLDQDWNKNVNWKKLGINNIVNHNNFAFDCFYIDGTVKWIDLGNYFIENDKYYSALDAFSNAKISFNNIDRIIKSLKVIENNGEYKVVLKYYIYFLKYLKEDDDLDEALNYKLYSKVVEEVCKILLKRKLSDISQVKEILISLLNDERNESGKPTTTLLHILSLSDKEDDHKIGIHLINIFPNEFENELLSILRNIINLKILNIKGNNIELDKIINNYKNIDVDLLKSLIDNNKNQNKENTDKIFTEYIIGSIIDMKNDNMDNCYKKLYLANIMNKNCGNIKKLLSDENCISHKKNKLEGVIERQHNFATHKKNSVYFFTEFEKIPIPIGFSKKLPRGNLIVFLENFETINTNELMSNQQEIFQRIFTYLTVCEFTNDPSIITNNLIMAAFYATFWLSLNNTLINCYVIKKLVEDIALNIFPIAEKYLSSLSKNYTYQIVCSLYLSIIICFKERNTYTVTSYNKKNADIIDDTSSKIISNFIGKIYSSRNDPGFYNQNLFTSCDFAFMDIIGRDFDKFNL